MNTNLAIHYFRTARRRHWIEQEVFLDPNFLVIKVFAAIANIAVDFIPACYPTAAAFGAIALPAAFLNGMPAGTAGILRYLQSIKPVHASPAQAALQALIESVLAEAIGFNLWGFEECYQQFTWPIMKDSLSRPFADWYCESQRALWKHKDVDLLHGKLKNVLETLGTKISTSRFLFDQDQPSIVDIVAYAYLSVLLSVPERFSSFKDADLLQRLKSYLLDFDDWLWQRADGALIPSGEPVTAPPVVGPVETYEETPSMPFLGKDYATQKSNAIFLACAGLSMATIGYLTQ